MAERCRCSCCGKQAYRNKHGRMMLHTKVVVGDKFGDPIRAEICEGSERGAKP